MRPTDCPVLLLIQTERVLRRDRIIMGWPLLSLRGTSVDQLGKFNVSFYQICQKSSREFPINTEQRKLPGNVTAWTDIER